MRVLYYDCFAGISGDMNLAAMLDLGVEEEHLRGELAKLKLGDEFALRVSREARCGIHGTRVDVELAAGHGHEHHPHRNLADIECIVADSDLSDRVKQLALSVFRRLAEAEAEVHSCEVSQIHFHEVGATDAIVDIVGAAICREALDADRVLCSTVALGSGTVTCAHGVLPVPAPATASLLKGIPAQPGTVPFEATTPTGAAILATLADGFTDEPILAIDRVGYGIGHRESDHPNVLRVYAGEEVVRAGSTTDAVLLECSVDDMTPEAIGYAMERFFDAGASDVNVVSALMKKGRPGSIISVLCSPEREPELTDLLFRETTTLGIKRIGIDKQVLGRRETTVETPWGPVAVKQALAGGVVVRSKPEFEDCAKLARREGLPLSAVYDAIRNGGGA